MKNLKLDSAPADGSTTPTESTAQSIADVASTVITDAAPFAAIAGPDGQLAIVAAEGALAAYKAILTLVGQLAAKGLISPAQQQATYDAYQQLDTHATAVFSAPEWQIVP